MINAIDNNASENGVNFLMFLNIIPPQTLIYIHSNINKYKIQLLTDNL